MHAITPASIARRLPGIGAVMAGALAVTLAAGGAIAHDAPKPDVKAEADLAKMLAGRVPGKPVDCITLDTTQNSTVFPHTAIVYENGGTLYVNRPNDADSLDGDQILVTKTWTDQLCRLDIVRLVDRGTRMESGFVGLESFTPYTRAPKDGTHGR